jgi:hypothetical protein
MAKRVSVYVDNQEEAILEEFCKLKGCTQSSAFRSMLRNLKSDPEPTARADGWRFYQGPSKKCRIVSSCKTPLESQEDRLVREFKEILGPAFRGG